MNQKRREDEPVCRRCAALPALVTSSFTLFVLPAIALLFDCVQLALPAQLC